MKFAPLLIVLLCLHGGFAQAAAPGIGSTWVEPKTGMVFVWVPAGCFRMGGDEGNYEQPLHPVCVQGFWMGKYEVTQAQYLQVTGAAPSTSHGPDKPVDTVSWDDATHFAEQMSRHSGNLIRLPSEAEWEYACRAGHEQGRYCGTGDPMHMAWFKDNSNHQSQPVGLLDANDWGLYDMSGNLWEWVQDCWHEDYRGAPNDGSAWNAPQCDTRVLRGGSWCNDASYLRAGFRYGNDPDGGECSGFRVVRMPK